MSVAILIRPTIFPEKRPEAGVVINDTIDLAEVNDRDGWIGFEHDPVERKINLKMVKGRNHKTTCNFFSKELQAEYKRLLMNPEEVKNSTGVHPIYRYVPEHNDKDASFESEMKLRKVQSEVIYLYKSHLKTGMTTERGIGSITHRVHVPPIEYQSRHIGVGFRKTGNSSTFKPNATQGTASTFQDTKAFKLRASRVAPKKNQFITTFHSTNVEDMRRIEAKLENNHRDDMNVKNIYCPPSEYCFRAELDNDPYGRPSFKTRTKPDQLELPPTLADKRSKEQIEKEQKEKVKYEQARERERLKGMGLTSHEKSQWINYVKLPDRYHYMGDGDFINYLEKGPYNEELRYNPEYHNDSMYSEKPYFRLFFRQLKANDKKRYLGYSFNPKEQRDPKFYYHKKTLVEENP